MCCRKGLEKEWDLERVLTKAFLQVDAALASEMYLFYNNLQNTGKKHELQEYQNSLLKRCFAMTLLFVIRTGAIITLTKNKTKCSY